ncbi:PPOX class F420-dependent oxidoreductase [Streptomyces sp. GMY02]|uniref:PPOX class F420-dependent oxidoreductase n=1 Tax=Streptomyces sp. GMY02 TaxID=1333528 RepID=UPI001C2C7078|nr:PPOX class F420-dependent oxidoreductase [Streptomyces sp. GMY02]QXE34006.1 PPOX class F420-dependent oxidoreductase [Streptomyces sp. GMY02]
MSIATSPAFEAALNRIGKGLYVSLTTFRKDGRAVVTPVGCVIEGGTLYVLTPPDTGKVKRIRNSGRVVIAPCNGRGTVPAGAPEVEGVARLLGEQEIARVQHYMVQRTFLYRLVRIADRVLRRKRPLVAIAVTES